MQTTTGTALIAAASDGKTVALLTSLRELKTDFADLPEALPLILKMHPQDFTWRKEGVRARGFVAQELDSLDHIYGQYAAGKLVNYDERAVLATAVKAIQEQQAEIEKLKLRHMHAHR